MEESLHLTQRQQGRLLVGRLRQVHHHADMRTVVLTLAVNPLSLIFGHPGTTLLAFAGMEVGIEYSQIRAVFIKHLIRLNVRVIDRNILVFFESDTVKTVGKTEDTIDDLRQFEIRP